MVQMQICDYLAQYVKCHSIQSIIVTTFKPPGFPHINHYGIQVNCIHLKPSIAVIKIDRQKCEKNA